MWELDFEVTGDYGLSDCTIDTEEILDFAEAMAKGLSQISRRKDQGLTNQDN